MNYSPACTPLLYHSAFLVPTYVFQIKRCGELQRLSFKREATGRVSGSLPLLQYLANSCALVMSEQYRRGCHMLLDDHENTASWSRGEDLSHVRIKKPYPNSRSVPNTQTKLQSRAHMDRIVCEEFSISTDTQPGFAQPR